MDYSSYFLVTINFVAKKERILNAAVNFACTKCSEDGLSIHGVSETVVGILGGGQLGRMLCQAASQMGIKVITLDPLENCPACGLSHQHVVGNFDDGAAVREFSKRFGYLDSSCYFVTTTC